MSVQDYPHLFEPIRLGNTFSATAYSAPPWGIRT